MKAKTPLTFEQAMRRAGTYFGRKRRLGRLVELAGSKSERQYDHLLGVWESLQIFFRMVRAWLSGRYSTPRECIVMVVAAVLYFVSPFDLIPDSVPVFGFLDDAAVIGYVAKMNLTAISNFRKWEILFSGEFPYAGR
jgi:uncharacterized membrane protein YkvA (DUF1232 family)